MLAGLHVIFVGCHLLRTPCLGPCGDAQLKLMVEAGTLPADALSQGALAEYLAAIGVQHRAGQTAAAKTTRGHATESRTDPVDDSKVGLAVDSIKVNVKVEIRPSALPGERRGGLPSQHFRGPGALWPTPSC